ncbi:MAG: iron ABC transporter permease [Acidimicrobiia bacterium]
MRAVDPAGEPTRMRWSWLAGSVALLAFVVGLGLAVGPVRIDPWRSMVEVAGHLPFAHWSSGLSARDADIVWELRLPRVLLAVLVGGLLAVSGASYQGVFRNPLADPYLLGAAAGAGLGVTIVVVSGHPIGGGFLDPAPIAAFVGAIGAAVLAYAISASSSRVRTPATLLLAGVAVMSFLTAVQTYLQQRDADTVRTVYSWILGRLTTATWSDVALVLPYFVVTTVVLVAHGRALDVMSVGDEEASSLGIPVRRVRLTIVAAASLATAAAVAVSGLIGFVGIIVPHTVRLLLGSSYRVIVPLSIVLGGAFLALADLLARTAMSPAEVPIGVVTAMVGAPFFIVVLRTSRLATG